MKFFYSFILLHSVYSFAMYVPVNTQPLTKEEIKQKVISYHAKGLKVLHGLIYELKQDEDDRIKEILTFLGLNAEQGLGAIKAAQKQHEQMEPVVNNANWARSLSIETRKELFNCLTLAGIDPGSITVNFFDYKQRNDQAIAESFLSVNCKFKIDDAQNLCIHDLEKPLPDQINLSSKKIDLSINHEIVHIKSKHTISLGIIESLFIGRCQKYNDQQELQKFENAFANLKRNYILSQENSAQQIAIIITQKKDLMYDLLADFAMNLNIGHKRPGHDHISAAETLFAVGNFVQLFEEEQRIIQKSNIGLK